jgi:hypothetical protein
VNYGVSYDGGGAVVVAIPSDVVGDAVAPALVILNLS